MGQEHNNVKKLKQDIERLQNYVSHLHDHLERTEDPDEVLLFSRPFNDLSASKFHKILQNRRIFVQILDVSPTPSDHLAALPNLKHIPFDEIEKRWKEVRDDIPVIVISGDGVTSLKSCDFLTKQGFININHLRGGHEALRSLFVH